MTVVHLPDADGLHAELDAKIARLERSVRYVDVVFDARAPGLRPARRGG